MKLLISLMIALFTVQTAVDSANAGNSVGNAGDITAMEFSWAARLAVKRLKEADLTAEQKRQVTAIEAKLDVVTIISLPKLFLDGKEVDAINYPEENLIELSQERWLLFKHATAMSRVGFALHEFLWLAGFDDKQFNLSKDLVDKIRDERFADVAFEENLLNEFWTLKYDLGNASLRALPDERKKDDTKSFCLAGGRILGRIQILKLFMTHSQSTTIAKQVEERFRIIAEAARNIELNCHRDSKNLVFLEDLKTSVLEALQAIDGLIESISTTASPTHN